MFLFETFTYDEEWAKKYYGSTYYNGNHNTYQYNTWYLDGIITDYKFKSSLSKEDIDRFTFTVNKFKIPDVNLDNLYKISYLVHYAYKPDQPFQKDQIDYLTNKLSILGDAVKIIAQYDAVMIIQYFIEKDEYRWNREHQRVEQREAHINAIKIPEPTEETWLEMFKIFTFGKSIKLTFKKIKTLDEALEKLVIAYKLKWPGGINAIQSVLYKFLKSDSINKDNPYSNAVEAAYRYSLKYNAPDLIQEFINDTTSELKQMGPIPTKTRYLSEKLDQNDYVKKYSIKQYRKDYKYDIVFVIYVELTNGNKAYITIQHPDLYMLRIFKNVEIVNNKYPQTKIEDKVGKDYFSLPNIKRSNHVLNDTIDVFLDNIIQDIYNMKK